MRLEIGQCTTFVSDVGGQQHLFKWTGCGQESESHIYLFREKPTDLLFGTEPFVHEGKMDFSVPAEKVNAI